MSMTGNIYPRICVSALSGGGGKTLLSLGLVRAYAKRGRIVQPFKKGPDYIDAAWLAAAAGRPATNLDPFFLGPEALRQLFVRTMTAVSGDSSPDLAVQPVLAVVEGNRGLFDGLDQSGSCSTSQLARTISCPVLLCLDCRKVTRTMAAIVRGVTGFEPGLDFAGLILNQVGSPRHESNLRSLLEAHTGLPVLGALPRLTDNPLPERHMGLASAGAGLAADVAEKLDALADMIAANCDLPAIEALATKAPALPIKIAGHDDPSIPDMSGPGGQTAADSKMPQNEAPLGKGPLTSKPLTSKPLTSKPLIGYVRDEVLWFYYPENLQALENAGARLVELAIARDADRLEQLDGLYLGGGFPEDHCQMLSTAPFLRRLSGLAKAGLPIYAECGGFILLASALTSSSLTSSSLTCSSLSSSALPGAGQRWPMAGIFDLEVELCAKPQGLGYVKARVTGGNPFFTPGSSFVGHEFHYSRCCPGRSLSAVLELEKGQGMGRDNGHGAGGPGVDGLVFNNVFAAYTHIFAPAVPEWATSFVRLAGQYQKNREEANEGLCDHSGLESF